MTAKWMPQFWSKWEIVKSLGQGGFSWVWQIKPKHSSDYYATLKLSKGNSSRDYKDLQYVSTTWRNELEACQTLKSEGYLTRAESIIVENPLDAGLYHCALLLDYRPGEDLITWCNQDFNVENYSKTQIIRRLLEILCEILHSFHKDFGFINGDVKPDNIILDIDQDGKVTADLVDFGYTQPIRDPLKNAQIGTVGYIPPEWLHESIDYTKNVDSSIDVFALGSSLISCIIMEPVYDLQDGKLVWAREIVSTEPLIPEDPKLELILRRMISTYPAFRPTCAEILRLLKCK